MRDSGTWLRPRYRAELQPVSLNRSAEQQYVFSGLPSESFSLNLSVSSPEPNTTHAAPNPQTRLSVVLTDAAGKALCSADGTIDGGRNIWEKTWIVATSANSAYLWTPKCMDMPISRGKEYRLIIRVDSAGSDLTPLNLVPILRGGGNELP